MKTHTLPRLAALVLCTALLPAFGHGDEPHGDAPHADASVASAGSPQGAPAAASPRFEAATEAFELVGQLAPTALTLYLQRYETNEPVLQARVEIESGERKAVAAYQAAQGSYVVSDPAFVQALGRPGEHPLVVTVTAGEEADLLETTLTVAAPPPASGEAEARPVTTALAGTLGLVALGAGAWLLRQRRKTQGVPA